LKLRESNIQKLKQGIYDVLIIGSGINGAVSAAALSGKGARVAIIDQRDFAGFTSPAIVELGLGWNQVFGKPRLQPGSENFV
jgi:glycerol-3-phosphate dehydrogenase